ncbi:hypothetical protein SLI_7390 [Streptomyces lividans 1326]|uniref:Uncharacterized protein n=1 Tax=Streptomyces lividans 1326 TaxID=1200984 RepID=A0A7U9DXS5_STRLI|nr:hypothetical protein SLI_7390 [Streptomyces lividans 1326]
MLCLHTVVVTTHDGHSFQLSDRGSQSLWSRTAGSSSVG